jgi:hypothetical protein
VTAAGLTRPAQTEAVAVLANMLANMLASLACTPLARVSWIS